MSLTGNDSREVLCKNGDEPQRPDWAQVSHVSTLCHSLTHPPSPTFFLSGPAASRLAPQEEPLPSDAAATEASGSGSGQASGSGEKKEKSSWAKKLLRMLEGGWRKSKVGLSVGAS